MDCNPPHGPEKPSFSSVAEDDVLHICYMCWQMDPEKRPSAVEILNMLNTINQKHGPEISPALHPPILVESDDNLTNYGNNAANQFKPSPSSTASGRVNSMANAWGLGIHCRQSHFSAHGSHVVTCLLLSRARIISAADDGYILVHSLITGQLIHLLEGHQGGVWTLAVLKETLVSGSTDRTVRVWDLKTGKCTHVFGGHTSTVRCLAIVRPQVIEVTGEDGVIRRERWPKRSLIVTGSRDHTLRVWTLPKPGEVEYQCNDVNSTDGELSEVCISPSTELGDNLSPH